MKKIIKDTIISVTSYPPRIGMVHRAIMSLLDQTVTAEKLILWLSEEDFPRREGDLPEALVALTGRGLSIEWCENLKSHKKLIPALEKYPDKTIITFDDDIIYDREAVETLYDCHIKHPDDILAHRICRMFFNEAGALDLFPRPMYYDQKCASLNYMDVIKAPSVFNSFTGVGGVLYPPGCLHGDVLDKKKCMALAPTNDDIWFWLQGVRNKTKVRVPETHFPELQGISGTQDVGLTRINDIGGLFDRQLQNVFEAYPDTKSILQCGHEENMRLINEIITNDSRALISVVCVSRNHGASIGKCLDGILAQRVKVSIEIIIIDEASTDNTTAVIGEYTRKYPAKIRALYREHRRQSGHGPIIPKHIFASLQGKYIAFCNGNDYWTDPDKLSRQFVFMERHPGFTLTSSGFSEHNHGTASEKIIRCGEADGFEYTGTETRGFPHYRLSTIFCRKDALEYGVRQSARFKWRDELHLAYYLLRSGPGWYYSENHIVHTVPADGVTHNKSDEIIARYKIYGALYKKTKDSGIATVYYQCVERLLRDRLYKNKAEKIKLLIVLYSKDSKAIITAIKKLISKGIAKITRGTGR